MPDADDDDYEDYGGNNNKGDKDKDDHSKDNQTISRGVNFYEEFLDLFRISANISTLLIVMIFTLSVRCPFIMYISLQYSFLHSNISIIMLLSHFSTLLISPVFFSSSHIYQTREKPGASLQTPFSLSGSVTDSYFSSPNFTAPPRLKG